jgi:3-hydroxymyristoyl/3-hydroxydecanoyl-(acyl carrier protein) dehydratase
MADNKTDIWNFPGHFKDINVPMMSEAVKKDLKQEVLPENHQDKKSTELAPLNYVLKAYQYKRTQQFKQLIALMTKQHSDLFNMLIQIIDLVHLIETTLTKHPSLINDLPGPKLTRADLEYLSHGELFRIFGYLFRQQADFAKQVRMPEPPLLLCDRVLGIEGEAGSMKTGVIWTETDVKENSWYLHRGRMPAGITIESGQADLLLISWLGIDFINRGQRVYRLLGCELCYHGELPKPGDTLHYEIHIDGHAQQGDVRLFFFHYDCTINGKLLLSVRHGQAGFFTAKEMAESKGVIWDPKTAKYDLNAPLDAPIIGCAYRQFSKEQIQHFANGDAFACFGPGFEKLAAHTATPSIQKGKMLFLSEVLHFDPLGGPWKRGYMHAIQNINADDWYFKGHFFNDPCMPGTLMLEAGLQVISIYMAALGLTANKDGWRFELIPEQNYTLRCRGQVIPSSKQVSYEIFVERIVAGPMPMLFADLLSSVDGLKSFHTKIGVRLVPDYPLENKSSRSSNEDEQVGYQDFKFDAASLRASALGKLSQAFGPMYDVFDGYRKAARLPAPPYQCLSKIISVNVAPGGFKPGAQLKTQFQIEQNAWYFKDNRNSQMPYCIFMEAALQPCGWLASYIGCALQQENTLLFRNLEGIATIYQDIPNHNGILTHHIHNTSINKAGEIILVDFTVDAFYQDNLVYKLETKFGFFPEHSFINQVGIKTEAREQEDLIAPENLHLDLNQETEINAHWLKFLPKKRLLMIDVITRFCPTGGIYGQGLIRAKKYIDPREWFFKSHFFQDPVQPGSLGIEAMLQVLKWYLLTQGTNAPYKNPQFEMAMLHHQHEWKYRGQVVPDNKEVLILAHIKETGCAGDGAEYVIATMSYWVDGIKIYQANSLAMRVREIL